MSGAASFNEHLWEISNGLGWLFWLPFVGYGTVGLSLMYRLAAASTTLGRVIRVILTIAFVSMVFIPTFNGLGSFIFHAVTIGMLLTIYQLYLGYKAAGLLNPPKGKTVLQRTVAKMVDLHKK